VPQVVLVKRFADNLQVLISDYESRLDLILRPDGPFPPKAFVPRVDVTGNYPWFNCPWFNCRWFNRPPFSAK